MTAWKSLKMNPKKGEEKKKQKTKADLKVVTYNACATWDFAHLGLAVPLVQGQETPK